MYRVTKEIRFCYGHRLLDYEGPCRHLHGHNGRVEITFFSERLDERGMVVDFDDIKSFVKGWVDATLDHRMLLSARDPLLPLIREAGEPVFVFEVGNPTAENIAKAIYDKALEGGFAVDRVRVWETDTSWAQYSG